MPLRDIKSVNSEQLDRILTYFRWKLEHDSMYIDETKLARYLEVSVLQATEILEKLYQQKIVKIEAKADCPQCEKTYTIRNFEFNNEIICVDCGSSFIPNSNKKLLKYYYLLNENSQYFNKFRKEEKPRLSIISKLNIRENKGMNDKKVKVFLSYSHADEEFKEKLDIHFAPLKRNEEKVETWNDRKLIPGTQFDEEIKKHLNEDDIIILLISADFINSDYCYEVEMKTALERMENSEAVVIPVIVRPCLWKKTPLGSIQALPKDGNPISKYQDSDDAYVEIVESVSNIIDSLIDS